MADAYVLSNVTTGEARTVTCAAAVVAVIDQGGPGVWRVAKVPTISRPAPRAGDAGDGSRCGAAPPAPSASPPVGRPAAT